jgi:hypothetical protein
MSGARGQGGEERGMSAGPANKRISDTQARGSQMPCRSPVDIPPFIKLVFDMIVPLSSCAVSADAGEAPGLRSKGVCFTDA